MLTHLTKSGDKMNQIPLAESLLEGVSAIARNANMLISDKVNRSEMMIFHMITVEEAETGQARIQLSKISRELCISRPAVTQCVDRMVSREMLVRCSDPIDRRAVYVELTEKGKEYFSTAKREAMDMVSSIISHMGEDNAQQLAYLLGKLKSAIETESKLMKS